MRLAIGLTLVLITAATGSVWAGAALDDDKKPIRTTDPMASPDSLTTTEDKVDYGIDFRLRSVYVPRGLLEVFVSRAAGGSQSYGYGIDLVRRRGNLELQLGFEYEHINPAEGVWINSNEHVPVDEADYILSPEHSGNNFGWFTFEFTFINHTPINKYVALRYGGGAGLGVLTGEIDHYNIQCSATATNANPEPGCVPPRFGGQGQYTDPTPGTATSVKYDVPPVFPVVNAIIGLQIKPVEHMVINIEGGIRTLPFLGTSIGYFF
ncbi:MAG: hypothetical protein JWO36_1805 [Myxococcales bacterium]|nr:hypothetical protein [Myxococcales bacterium]